MRARSPLAKLTSRDYTVNRTHNHSIRNIYRTYVRKQRSRLKNGHTPAFELPTLEGTPFHNTRDTLHNVSRTSNLTTTSNLPRSRNETPLPPRTLHRESNKRTHLINRPQFKVAYIGHQTFLLCFAQHNSPLPLPTFYTIINIKLT